MSGTMPCASSDLMTPMCAKPRAAPPPSTSATRRRRGGLIEPAPARTFWVGVPGVPVLLAPVFVLAWLSMPTAALPTWRGGVEVQASSATVLSVSASIGPIRLNEINFKNGSRLRGMRHKGHAAGIVLGGMGHMGVRQAL